MKRGGAPGRVGLLPRLAIGALVTVPCAVSSAAAPASSPAPAARAQGVLVVAQGDTAEVTWPLAREVYVRPSLRPSGLDEARARVLAGEAPMAGAPQSVRDLADTRAAIHGDDAPSRHLLASLAHDLHVRAVVVVSDAGGASTTSSATPAEPPLVSPPLVTTGVVPDAGASSDLVPQGVPVRRAPVARVFLADSSSFDAARYTPDDTALGAPVAWLAATQSIERAYGTPNPAPLAKSDASKSASPGSASHAAHEGKEPSRPFYTSPWFWGAIGAAAFGATAIYFATRDNSDGTIHLQMQVPK